MAEPISVVHIYILRKISIHQTNIVKQYYLTSTIIKHFTCRAEQESGNKSITLKLTRKLYEFLSMTCKYMYIFVNSYLLANMYL